MTEQNPVHECRILVELGVWVCETWESRVPDLTIKTLFVLKESRWYRDESWTKPPSLAQLHDNRGYPQKGSCMFIVCEVVRQQAMGLLAAPGDTHCVRIPLDWVASEEDATQLLSGLRKHRPEREWMVMQGGGILPPRDGLLAQVSK